MSREKLLMLLLHLISRLWWLEIPAIPNKAIGLVAYCNLIKASWMHLIDHYASSNYDISVQIIEYGGVLSRIFKCFGNGVDGYCDRVNS
ncbi:hypothetical protein Hanom_Chr12g01177511 [Helianthus anomalus]